MKVDRYIFLDRDGIINVDKGYVFRPVDVEFVPGIIEFLREVQLESFKLIVVTNQSGIGRGLYSEEEFNEFTLWLEHELLVNSIKILETFYCPYHSEFGLGKYKKDSSDRKPHPGMILKAASKYGIDLTDSILIGDRSSDVKAANSANVGDVFFLHNSKHTLDFDLKKKCKVIHDFSEIFGFL